MLVIEKAGCGKNLLNIAKCLYNLIRIAYQYRDIYMDVTHGVT